MKKIKFLFFLLSVCFFIASPLVILAQEIDVGPPDVPPPPISDLSEFQSTLEDVVRFVGTVFWILTVLFLVIAAFYYLTSAGSEDKIKKGKSVLKYAIIAIVIALFANGASLLISNILVR